MPQNSLKEIWKFCGMTDTGRLDKRIPSGRLFLCLLALYILFVGPMAVGPHGLWPDEALYMGATKNLFAGKGLTLGFERGIFPVLPLLSGLVSLFTGFSKLPFYLATVLAGLLAITGTYFLGKRLLKSDFLALAAAAILATNTIFIFYSARILLDVYDAAIIAGGLLAIFWWMDKPGDVLRGAVLGLSVALAYLVRVPNAAALGCAALAALGVAVWNSKKLPVKPVLAGALSLCVPVLLWIAVTKTSPLGVYGAQDTRFLESIIIPNIPNLIQSLGFFFNSWIFLALAVAGVFTFIGKRELAPLIAVLVVAPLVRLPGVPYDARYLTSIIPLCAIFLVSVLAWIGRKGPAFLEIALPIGAVLLLAALSIPAAQALYEGKKGGYLEIEYSGEWLKKNTEQGEIIFSGAYRIVGLFSERDVRPLPLTPGELFSVLDSTGAKYIEIDNYDWAQPKYALTLFQDNPGNFSVETQFVNQANGGGSLILKYLKNS
jgi:4-amino-4-deoxy-L-arabinose transferase-like glycosyltransferase